MGQYYTPCILSKDKKKVEKSFYSWHYENGLKLMEHSYVNNWLVLAVERYLFNNPKRLVWCGDYAEMDYYKLADKNLLDRIAPVEGNENHLDDDQATYLEEYNYDNLKEVVGEVRYIVNHDKKLLARVEKTANWTIHPLSLLTAVGNGLGGGDYHGTYQDLVGTWATDVIEVVNEEKAKKYQQKGYVLETYEFKEE